MHTMPACVDGLHEIANTATTAVPIKEHCSSYKYSFDFNQYLLSSSPPGFGYNLIKKSENEESLRMLDCQGSDYHQFSSSSTWYTTNNPHKKDFSKRSKEEKQQTSNRNAPPVSGSSEDNTTLAKTNGPAKTSVHTCVGKNIAGNNKMERRSHGRVKKVSFADDYGLRLAEINYFIETPDMPPIIKTKMMLHSAKLLPFSQNCTPSLSQKVMVNPSLVPDFPMPISNHMAFRQKLEQKCVSLESLYVATNQTLAGTVKVKNLGFVKTVFVRCTFDAWKSSTDIPCSYRPASYLEGSDFSCDCFSFTIDVPSSFDAKLLAEFAVCYQCNGNEYWDNNGGENYRLISPDWLKKDTNKNRQNFTDNMNLKWTTYIEWNHRSLSWPYW